MGRQEGTRVAWCNTGCVYTSRQINVAETNSRRKPVAGHDTRKRGTDNVENAVNIEGLQVVPKRGTVG